ncbi:MAG: C39 family peptidase [bacterium]
MSIIKKYFILLLFIFLIGNAGYTEIGEKIEKIDPPANCGANWTEDIDVCRRCHKQSSGRDSFGIQSFGLSSDECGGNSTYVGPMQTETTSDGKLILTHPYTTATVGTNLCFGNSLKINGYAIAYYYYEDDVVKHEDWWPDADTTYTRRHFYAASGIHNYKVKVIYCSSGAPSCGTGWIRLTKEWMTTIGEGEINLAVPYYSQRDTTSWNGYNSTGWANEIYDSVSPPNNKIKNLGCVLTDLVMVLRFYGVAYGADSADVNPKNLNIWLNRNKGYDPGGLIRWYKVEPYSSDQVVFNNFANSFDTLDSDLKNGNPVILKVPREYSSTHFVVVKGKTTGTYKINDPASTTKVTLESYDNRFDTGGRGGLRRFARKTVEKGKMEIHANCPVELLLIDSQGRRLGYEPVTKTIITEISGSYIEEDAPYPLLEEGEIPPPQKPPAKILFVNELEEDNFSLQTYGTGNGYYTLTVGIILPTFSGERSEEVDVRFDGVTREGLVSDYPITVTTSRETSKMEHIITLTSMKEDIEILFQLGDIDNQGIKNSLLKKLEAAEKAEERNDNKIIENILNAFKNEVEAQKEKHISEKGAKILLDDADYLLNHL